MTISARIQKTARHHSTLFALIGATLVSILGILFVTQANAAEAAETTFTMAVVPDTQQEVMSDGNTLMSNRYQWLADNSLAMNLKFITHTGDVVNWGVVDPVQFTRANSATTILDNLDIPFSYAIGNHDTAAVKVGGSAAPGSVRENLRNTTAFNQTFPLSRFKNVEGTFETGKVDNMYQIIRAGGVDWLMITHEMWPRATVIEWMKTIVASHPQHNVVVSTHAFLGNDNTLPTSGNYGDQNALQEWNNFISQYANIKMVISGHYGPKNGYPGYAYKESVGVNGNKIAQIMTAYHSSVQNHVRLLSIDTANNTIHSSVYVNQSLNSSYPTGYVLDGASNFVTTSMNWIRPAVTDPTPDPDPEPVITAPSAPTAVTATAGIGSATVSFATPSTDGGSPITSYQVVSSPGNATVSATTSPIIVSGLTAGTSYNFTVTATNSIGVSPVSAASNSVTPLSSNPQLLSDPGFEVGVGGWKAFSSGTLTNVTSPIRSGAKSLRVNVPTSGKTNLIGLTHNTVISNSVAGKTYTATCYVNPSISNLNITMRFLEYTQSFSSVIHFPTTVRTINNLPVNTWTQVSVTATAVKSGERMIPQIYSTNQTNTTGSMRYDDCSVQAVN